MRARPDDDRKWDSRLFAATMALAALAEVLVVASGQGHHVRVQEEQAWVAALDALGHQVGDEQPDNIALLAIAEQRCREGRPPETGSAVATVPRQSPSGHRSLPVTRGYIRGGTLFRDNAAAMVGL